MASQPNTGRASALPLGAFQRALLVSAALAGCSIAIADASSVDWQSRTFAGSKVAVRLTAEPSPKLDAWLASLPGAPLPMSGPILADLAVQPTSAGVEVRALILAEQGR